MGDYSDKIMKYLFVTNPPKFPADRKQVSVEASLTAYSAGRKVCSASTLAIFFRNGSKGMEFMQISLSYCNQWN